jgi:hypothetical protein
VNVNADFAAESTPDEYRGVEQRCLGYKNHRQPLVVINPFSSSPFQRQAIIYGQIICV